MRQFEVVIKGVTPYMQHRMDDQKLEDWEKKRGKIIERAELALDDVVRAEFHCYRNLKTGKCYFPIEHLMGAFIGGGGYLKSKVGTKTKSMKSIVAGMFQVTSFDAKNPDQIEIPEWETIDKRTALNNKVSARIIVIRPKWNEWQIKFILKVDEDTITSATIKDIVESAGKYVGVGSFRPEKNGRFGRFDVLKLEEIKGKVAA